MTNYIDYTVKCARYPGSQGFFRVYYVRLDGKWLPLPVDVCDNGCACETCHKCGASVISLARKEEPPFPR